MKKTKDLKNLNKVKQNLNKGWKLEYSDKNKWIDAVVPGNVHLDLLRNNLIPDPFFGQNETKLQWISDKNWTYKLIFNVDSSIFSKGKIEILFHGLDTYADIYLNGVKLDTSDFTATNGTSIVLGSAAQLNDVLVVVSFGTFTLANFSAGNIGSGTLPTARGGTGLSSLGSAGQVMKVNNAGNALEFGNASSAEVYGFNLSYSPSTVYYNVAVQAVGGANKYFILGEQQKTLELLEGNTYIFDHPSAHPLRFSTDSGNSSAYTTGVTVVSSTRVQIVVASGAPTLYYYCSQHSGMGGQANTPVPFDNNLQVTTTNQGADNITNTQYAAFDDVLFSASGFTFSLSNGSLIATI